MSNRFAALRGRPLTERDIEVFELVMAGLLTREIAEKCFMAVGTVEVHRQAILAKLGARTTPHAVYIYLTKSPPAADANGYMPLPFRRPRSI